MKLKRKHNLIKQAVWYFPQKCHIAVCGNESNICLITSHFIRNDD